MSTNIVRLFAHFLLTSFFLHSPCSLGAFLFVFILFRRFNSPQFDSEPRSHCGCVAAAFTAHHATHESCLFVCLFVRLFVSSITKCMTITVQNTFQALVQKERAKWIFIAIFHVVPLMIDGHYIWPRLTTDTTWTRCDWPLQKSVPAQGNCRAPRPAIFLTHSPQFQNTCDLPRSQPLKWNLHSIEMPQGFFLLLSYSCVVPLGPRSFLKACVK